MSDLLTTRALAAQPHAVLAASVVDGAAEIARLREALQRIADWANAYPLDQFPDQDLKKADKALAFVGVNMSAMHGQWARHIVTGIGGIAATALEATK